MPWIQRRARLLTLQRAGEAVSPSELQRLDAALARHAEEQEGAERAESEAVACRAQLVEIASAAARVRRGLVTGGNTSADEVVAHGVHHPGNAEAAFAICEGE